MHHVTANLTAGKARRETRNGRAYLVAPLTLIVEGVLNGSRGPLYYPGDEIAASADDWNGMPLLVYHPKGSSARNADDWMRSAVGNVFGVSWNEKTRKLRGKGWFDEELTLRIDPRVHNALKAGQRIEVSTGLSLTPVEAAAGATFNGASYTHTATKYRPDHVAVLPDQVGACSVLDGCGVFNRRQRKLKPMPKFLRELARMMRLVREEGGRKRPKPAPPVPEPEPAVANELSHDQLREHLSAALRARFTQDEPHCWVYEVFDDYLVYEQRGRLWRVGYAKSDAGVILADDPSEVVQEINYVSADGDATMNRTQTIEWLVANCACWKDGKADLEKLTDNRLAALKAEAEKAPAANAAPAYTPPPVPAPVPAQTPVPAVSRAEVDALVAQLAATNAALKAIADREQAAEVRERQSMVDLLVANVADQAERERRAAIYGAMGREALALMLADRGQAAPVVANYAGAAGVAVAAGGKSDADNLLPTHTIDHDEFASPALRRKAG